MKESLGEKLKNARNEKGFTIDQISRETNISIRFLEALEAENFSVFPGEPYIIGFLRNYSIFLDLDDQKIIALYRALRIQEQPVPVEHLLKPPPKIPGFLLPLLLILIGIGAAGWGIYSLIIYRQNRPAEEKPAARTPSEFIMEGNSMEKRLYINDAVLFTVDSESYKIELFNLSETVTIRTPSGREILDLSQEASIDLNNDGIPELRITVADFAKNKPEMGTLLHFYLMDTSLLTGLDPENQYSQQIQRAPGSTASIMTIIPPSPDAYPFTLQIQFQAYCMFRWEILNERDRRGTNQRYFQRNDALDIQAQNDGIRIWVSNASAARFQVIGRGQRGEMRAYPVEIGTAGEVVVAEIRWVRDEEGIRVIYRRLET
ncbi:MAG: helix-turn-helix domain-containing protein [Treponema sp.]|nr:helix-turn-helix domain-containing protein [Treponema sp.]MCL2250451.1 helix-turn-helix domain-containing protein [Treponema sp.]